MNSNTNMEPVIKDIFDDSVFYYILKKTEKIVLATYLISNLLKDNEPLKTSFRESGQKFIRDVFDIYKGKEKLETIISDINYLQTMYSLGLNSGLVSQMNYQIIFDELEKIKKEIQIVSSSPTGIGHSVISKSFFKTIDNKGHIKDNKYFKKDILKGHNSLKNNQPVSKSGVINFNKRKDNSTNILEKEDRFMKILSFIKKEGPVSIKDISIDIPNVSEKTIQRDLISLINKGLIKKEGERRWSKYVSI